MLTPDPQKRTATTGVSPEMGHGFGYCSPGAEWRIEVTRQEGGLDVLTVRAELDGSGFANRIRQSLYDRVAVQPVVEAVPPGSLERFQGKASRVIDSRPSKG